MRTSSATRSRSRSGACTLLAVITLAVATVGCAARRPAAPPSAPDAGRDVREVEVGYGTTSRRDVTTAVGSVSACDLGATRVTSVEELLQGRVAGVEVSPRASGGSTVRVRGARSFTGDAEPLFVLDGMPLSAGTDALSHITPQEVQRIDVLKDASSTAIYGSRGMNGVIVITTKKGKGSGSESAPGC